ncbi:MAG: hypothetical protein ACFCU4_11080 [Puniceicoccaceae bacterium]
MLPSFKTLRILLLISFFGTLASAQAVQKKTGESDSPTRFTVVAYNVENLFDIDGVAAFDDYQQVSPPNSNRPVYTPEMLLKKVQGHVQVLKQIGNGTGPEIILFQEFERDRTPESTIKSPEDFLRTFRNVTLEDMIKQADDPAIKGLPSYAFMLKGMEEAGMGPYQIAVPDTKEESAHINVTFSKFPIRRVIAHPLVQAREILEVHIEIDGHLLLTFNNHWKAGASNPQMETIRVGNARVLRRRIDHILRNAPTADIIIGGDLNSYHNQSAIFDSIKASGINDVLRSQGNESLMYRTESGALYNLWYELPRKQRYSEVWRGMYGTLMHLIVTPGLYDGIGVRYVDNSFRNVILPGLNVDVWGRPLSWRFDHGGHGLTDHLPVAAEFEVVRPGMEDREDTSIRMVDYSLSNLAPDYEFLELTPSLILDILPRVWEQRGEIYRFDGKIFHGEFPVVQIGNSRTRIWAPDEALFKKIQALKAGTRFAGFAEFVLYQGRPEIVIQDASWITSELN